MASSIRVLIIDDSDSDAGLLIHQLEKGGLKVSSERVEDGKTFKNALETRDWDIILSDINLPGFDALAALTILRQTEKDIPMIIVSGTVNEEKAIELLRLGASDYLMKDHLARLVPAVKREMEEAQLRRTHLEAQEELWRANERYKILFDQSPYGVLIIDSETTLPIEFNDIAHNQLGYTREEFFKVPIKAFEVLESQADVKARIDRLYRTGSDEFDTLQRTKQGEIRNVHVILRLIDIDGRKLQHCIYQDVTEKVKAVSALQESEAAFGDIFQTVTDGIAYTTFSGEVLAVNQALLKILDLSREDLIGKNILTLTRKLLRGKNLEKVMPILTRILKGEEIETFEVEYEHKILEINTLINKKSQRLTGVIRDITQRKLIEKEVKENEALLSAMVSNISDVIAILDLDGTIRYKSPNIENIFGWKPEELIGKSGFVTVHPDDLSEIHAKYETLLELENQPQRMEYRYLCKDGSYRLVAMTAINLIKNPDIHGILLNYHDITEQRRMELDFAVTDEKFRKAFTTSPDSININRLHDGMYMDINEGFMALTGYTRDEIIGKTSLELNIWANPDDRARLVKGLRESGKVINLEATFQGKDGTTKICLMSANIIEINGETCILSITRDITDRRQMILDLSRAEEKFRKAFETSPDCIAISSLSTGLIMDFNTGFLDLTGYTREEIFEKTSAEINLWAKPEDRSRMIKMMQTDGKVLNMEVSFRVKDGSIKTCLLSANSIEVNGETCLLTIVRDISDRIKADESIKLQSAALNAVSNAVVITDAKDRYILWTNPAFFELSGFTNEDAVGKTLHSLVCSNLHEQAFYENIWQTTARGEIWSGEIFNRRKNGEIYPEEMTITPIFGQDGKIDNFIVVKQDISEKKLHSDIMKSRVHLLEYAVNQTLDKLLKETLKEAENLTGSQIGFYHFLEQDEKTVSLQAWSNRTEEKCFSTEGTDKHYPLEKAGIWVDCVRERRPIIHNDFASVPNRKGLPPGHVTLIRELVVPVFRDNKIVAILGVGNKSSDYTKREVEIVARLADLAWDVAEKKISDKALLESEKHFRELVVDLDRAQSIAHLGSWTWNIENDQVIWSDEMFRIFGLDRVSFSGKYSDFFNRSIHPEDRKKVEEADRFIATGGKSIPLEYRVILPDQTVRTIWTEAGELISDKDGKPISVSGVVQDITDRKIIEERVEAERELLHLCNQADTIKNLGARITAYLKDLTHCEAVGMRLKHGDDFPYFETIGFPAKFTEKEKFLCAYNPDGTILRDAAGNPYLECMCGNIIQSRIHLEKPYFTPNGSFWSNSTTELLANTTEDDRQARTRNRCNGEGYESVALIPIRHNSQTFGLFQFNDKRKGHFTPSQIEMLEHLANLVAIALAKIESDAALVESEKRYKDLFEHAAVPNILEDFSGAAKIFSEIHQQGITDLRTHFENHPELVEQCAQQIKIVDVNQACVEFFKVPRREDLFTSFASFFTESTWPSFREEIIALAEGADYFEGDLSAKTFTGDERQINLQLSVDPAYANTLSRVMVSFIDVTERNRAEKALEKRVLALTQPLENGGTFAFEDLFNLEDIQKIQDEFANATGVASLILKPDGTAITRPSNFCRLCNDIIRKSEKGQVNCMRSDAQIGSINLDGAIIQPCLSGGLWDAGAAIMVGGQHVASWLVGQVRDETQTEANMREYAREIGVDETEYIKAFYEVTPMSYERFSHISEALFTFANQLSTMAYQNAQQARFINERNRAEEALKLRNKIFTHSLDMLFIAGFDGMFKVINPAWHRNLGWSV